MAQLIEQFGLSSFPRHEEVDYVSLSCATPSRRTSVAQVEKVTAKSSVFSSGLVEISKPDSWINWAQNSPTWPFLAGSNRTNAEW